MSMVTLNQWINGNWLPGTGEEFYSHNPANGKGLSRSKSSSTHDVELAVQAAHHALPDWSGTTLETRAAICQKFVDALSQERREFATLISKENGKPIWESELEVAAMIAKFKISLQAQQERNRNTVKPLNHITLEIRHKPLGVIAVLGPFNFPGHIPNGQIIPALLAGNTVVLKPSEQTPGVAVSMCRLWEAAGLPPGVLNLIMGNSHVGKALLNQDIQAVFFTGSYATGKAIHQHFAGRVDVLLALEMGGNNPLIVWDVENLKVAVSHIIQSAFITSGQRCTCARRLIIPKGAAGKPLMNILESATERLEVAAFDENPQAFMGSMISENARTHILEKQAQFCQLGATSIIKSQPLRENSGLLSPGIIDVTAMSPASDEEIFGPLLQVIRVNSLQEAITVANQTQYGLSAGILTDKSENFSQFYERINAGLINWNRPLTGSQSIAPFGGVGNSGNHRPGAYYTADYCVTPIAMQHSLPLQLDEKMPPGIYIEE